MRYNSAIQKDEKFAVFVNQETKQKIHNPKIKPPQN